MDVALHLGVHGTDDERLLLALLKNRAALAEAGTRVPPSRSYRQMLPKLVRSLRGAPAGGDAQEMLRDALLGEEKAKRLILSHENLSCFPAQAVGPQGLYPYLDLRLAALANIFPTDRCHFYVALRNPATLVPELLRKTKTPSLTEALGDLDPRELRWGPLLLRMLEAVPDAELVFWCNEDTPLLWPDILAEIAGDGAPAALEGEDDMLSLLLTDEGMAELQAFVETADGHFTPDRRRNVTADFLERYARPEEMEVTIDLPGWTPELIAELTAGYDEDVARISALPGVRFLLP